MSQRRRDLRPVADAAVLRKIAGRRATGKEPIQQLREHWAAIFPQLVDHAWPERFSRAGVATIACTDAGWAQELSAESDAILASIAKGAKALEIRQLRFIVGSVSASLPTGGSEVPMEPTRISPSAATAARLASANVADPALRARLERLVALALSLRDQRQHAGDVGPD